MDLLDRDACYRALQTRDARFDGRLFTGVTSTGIYCRPVCPARTPLRRAEAWRPWRAYAAQHLWAADAEAEALRPRLLPPSRPAVKRRPVKPAAPARPATRPLPRDGISDPKAEGTMTPPSSTRG